MSKWYTVKDNDIELEEETEEVHVLFDSDDSGNIYLILTYDQIKLINSYFE